jgi:hypothetical protein
VPDSDHEYFHSRSDLLLSPRASEEQTSEALADLHRRLGALADRKAVEPTDDLISSSKFVTPWTSRSLPTPSRSCSAICAPALGAHPRATQDIVGDHVIPPETA